MVIKPLCKSVELRILSSLNTRMNLTTTEKQQYLNIEKGYVGELDWEAQLVEKLTGERLILSDLLLEINNSTFQIDSLIISQEMNYLFDVKNFEGDYFHKSDAFHTMSKSEIKNPLHQLKRCETLLRQFLHKLGVNSPLQSYLIFINPEFHLYQAPQDLPIIFPTQLNRFIETLNSKPSKMNGQHTKLANQLIAAHKNKSPFTRLPDYTYEQLEKGIICGSCNSFLVHFSKREFVCNRCDCNEDVESAVLRSVEEFKLLFPDKKVTTNTIFEWCKLIESKKKIQRILTKNFRLIGHGKFSYFVNT